MRGSFRCNGVHQRVLDSGVSDPGVPRTGGVSRQRAARKECSRQEDRRVRLPVASVPPFCGSVASQLPSSWLHLCYSLSLETPQQSDPDGGRACAAHAEGARPNEPPDSSRPERHHRTEWPPDTGSNPGWRTGSVTLARLCHGGVKNSEDTIAKSLEGDYRPEHLFALRQSLAAFHYYQQLVVEVDQEIQGQLGSLETATTAEPTVPKRTKASAYQRRRYEPKTFDLRGELYRIFGVDLTNVPGISAITAQTVLCEIGTDVSRFRNASAFASWLGLCPENKISGGKVLYTKSRRVRSRVATALRMAANSLHHAKDYLGEFFRRITRKLGKPQAITATAHKLARIVYHLLSTKEAYNETVFHRCDEEAIKRAQYRLRKQAAQLGFQVIPLQNG